MEKWRSGTNRYCASPSKVLVLLHKKHIRALESIIDFDPIDTMDVQLYYNYTLCVLALIQVHFNELLATENLRKMQRE